MNPPIGIAATNPTDPGPATVQAGCPRCGGGFECGASAGHCDCFDIRLTERLREQLAQRYTGRCLCLRCLRELVQAEPAVPQA